MTKIIMDWQNFRLTAKGHAHWGPLGNDVVCAAVSVLTQTLLNALMEANDRGRTGLTWKMDEEKGEISMEANPLIDYRGEIRSYFKMARIGFRAIAENYPGNIKFVELHEEG